MTSAPRSRTASRGRASSRALAPRLLLAALTASAAIPQSAAIAQETLIPAPAASPDTAAPRVHLPAAREVRLPNGALLILAEKHDVPLIAFEGYLRGGAVTDPPGREGVAALTAEMLRKGAGRLSAQEVAAAVDGVGGHLATGSGIETTWISGEFMARDQGLMLDLLRMILREPAFPDSELTKLRDQTVEAIRAAKDEPQAVLGEYAAAYFYGAHPYGRPVSGDEETVGRLTRDDVLASYRANFGGDRLILAVVGDFEARTLEGKLRKAFGSWEKATGTLPAVDAAPRRSGRRVLLVDKPDAVQSYFWLGNLGTARTDSARVALGVVNTAFGGRFTSMLNTALRVQSGLTYGARSRLTQLSRPGTLAITSYTKTESTVKAIDLALETLERFRASGLDETALRSTTRYIQGQYPPGFETSAQIADAFALLAFYGLPPAEVTDYPARVGALRDPASLRPVIQRVYPAPGDLTIVVVGNAKAIRSDLARYGPVAVVSIQDPLLSAVRRAH